MWVVPTKKEIFQKKIYEYIYFKNLPNPINGSLTPFFKRTSGVVDFIAMGLSTKTVIKFSTKPVWIALQTWHLWICSSSTLASKVQLLQCFDSVCFVLIDLKFVYILSKVEVEVRTKVDKNYLKKPNIDIQTSKQF